MTAEVVAMFGIAATLAVAALSAEFALIKLMIKFTADQTQYRHDLRSELQSFILLSESRVTSRIERLEQSSRGFADRYRNNGDQHNGE